MAQKTIVLTFDDACVSHLSKVVPLLKKFGFGATFFISRPSNWLEQFSDAYLSGEQISEIYRAGFEIGNHTVNHPDLRGKSPEECLAELQKMDEFLARYGIPKPISFAYPGGPYAENAAPVLQAHGLQCARTTEHGVWDKNTDQMRIPCYAVCDKDAVFFEKAVKMSEDNQDGAAVILYHGIPDEPHPWCSTDAELFESHMNYLYCNNFRVVSMAGFLSLLF